MNRCDAIDGLKDGLIDDPAAAISMRGATSGRAPLKPTTTAVSPRASPAAVTKIYAGPQAAGKQLFPGFMHGSEAPVAAGSGSTPSSAWMNLIVPAQAGGKAADFNLAENTMRYLVPASPQPEYDYRRFDFEKDPPLLNNWGGKANAKSTDLAKFRSRGGKLLMTYGWADQVLQPLMGVDYYERALASNGAGTPGSSGSSWCPG